MNDIFSKLVNDNDYLIADGATGTNMFLAGLQPGRAPDLWNLDGVSHVADLHTRFIEAGANIILTNTFGSNPCRLKFDNMADKTREINLSGAQIARTAANAATKPIIVAGNVGPTGEMMEPLGNLTKGEAEAAFFEQMSALAEGGVDILWIETIFALNELEAAVNAGFKTGLPMVATMTFDTNSMTMMGDAPEKVVSFIHSLLPKLSAFGANCGSGPAMLIDTLARLSLAAAEDDIIVAKGNCGIPEMIDGEIVYSGTNKVMATYARLARDCGAKIIGGCCGTTAERLKAISSALDGYIPRQIPSQDTIIAELGPIKPINKDMT